MRLMASNNHGEFGTVSNQLDPALMPGLYIWALTMSDTDIWQSKETNLA